MMGSFASAAETGIEAASKHIPDRAPLSPQRVTSPVHGSAENCRSNADRRLGNGCKVLHIVGPMKLSTILLASVALTSTATLIACETDSPATSPATPGPIDFDAGGGGFDGGPVASTCAPLGAAVKHDKTIETDETWPAGLHEVTFDIAVRKDATLTLAPCAVVRVIGDRGISVGSGNAGDGGKIVARGTAQEPIVVEGIDTKRWNHVLINSNGHAELAYTTIKNGGGTSSRSGGALHLYGDQYKPIQALAKVDHVTIQGSGKYGVVLEGRGAFEDGSQDLVISGSGDMAMRANAPAAGTIPSGQYTGNTVDAIRVMGSGGYDIIDADVTIHDRGVPYVVGGDGAFNEMSVQGADGTQPMLTIEAGVTLKFGKVSSGLFIDRASSTNAARGGLRVLGTAQKPVVFTSNEATPAAGDWTGIHFRGLPHPQSKIDFARVEYAGADTGTRGFSCGTPPSSDPSSNEAAIAIFGQPSSAFVTNTVISNSAANGIERAWTGTPVDFLSTNTFTNIAYCKQTLPRPSTGSCPTPVTCDL